MAASGHFEKNFRWPYLSNTSSIYFVFGSRLGLHELYYDIGLLLREALDRLCVRLNMYLVISLTGKATDYKFGRYIHRVHPNKSPLKILEKRERRRI